VPKSTNVLIAIRGANRSADIWGPDAEEWKPERWLSPLPDSVAKARIPGMYRNMMTFLAGGHACIGFKFAQLEEKVVLSLLLESFVFSLVENKDIVWNFAAIVTPTVKGEPHDKLQLPLKLTPVQRSSRLGVIVE